MKFYITPSRIFGLIILVAITLTLGVIFLAKDQYRWGITFQENDILMTSNGSFTIQPMDLIAEPGEFTTENDLDLFYSRQNEIQRKANDEGPIFLLSQGRKKELKKNNIQLGDLPSLFWTQIIVGLGAIIVTGWIFSLRPGSLASIFFLLSGFSTMCFTYAAAIYTTRELFLPVDLFRWLVKLNVLGASLFGIFILALFLIYPIQLRFSKKLIFLESFAFGAWVILSLLDVLPVWAGVNFITLTEMIFILGAIVTQIFASRGHPIARASLTWLGLSIILGAGGFIAMNAAPLFFGFEIPFAQGYAFLFFLIFYFGLAAGIGKYRLFDVGPWAYRFLFYTLGAFFLILLDAGLLSILSIERLPALGLSVFVVGLFYLPLRGWFYQRISNDNTSNPIDLIKDAILVSMSNGSLERTRRWEQLIKKAFNPIEIIPHESHSEEVKLIDNGAALQIPGRTGISTYLLRYRNGGKSLFNRDSVSLIKQMLNLLDHADSGKESYERGVKEERFRIAQDLHDDVGAKLLTGLHAHELELRSIIKNSISDIRDIVRGISGEESQLSTFLADLRIECMNRVEAADLKLNWPVTNMDENFKIDYHISKAISSTTRELFTNAIKHSDATTLDFQILKSNEAFEIAFRDNGSNFPENLESIKKGLGLKSIKKRVSDLGGNFELSKNQSGLQINIRIPI